jgi:LmbE family N-acetylglucosaminyl deacetylase
MSVPIAEHRAQNTHVLILTSGGASAAIGLVNDELAPGAPLTGEEFMAAREAEAERAVKALTCPYDVKVHFAHLADGQVTTEDAKAAILALADQLSTGPVRLKGHSYLAAVEPHADHRAIGQAIVALGAEQPARFGDRRFYVLPHSWGYTGTLPGKAWDYPADADTATRVHLAADAYCLWAPPVSYSIGCLSVPGLFATLDATPKALVHQ